MSAKRLEKTADFERPFNLARKLGFIPELQCDKASQKPQLTFMKIGQHLRNVARHVHTPFGCPVSCGNHQIEDLRVGEPFSEIGSVCIVPINGCGGDLHKSAIFTRINSLLSITLS